MSFALPNSPYECPGAAPSWGVGPDERAAAHGDDKPTGTTGQVGVESMADPPFCISSGPGLFRLIWSIWNTHPLVHAMATVVETTTLVTSSRPVRRPARRRVSTSVATRQKGRTLCQSLSPSVDALDLPFSSPLPVLATLRLHVLSYLADLEAHLALLESPITAESLKSRRESTVEEARVWANTALEMLNSIRSDVCSHLPELHLDSPSVEDFVKSHMPNAPRLDDVRAHLPAMPDAVRSRLPDLTMPDMRSRLEDVRSSISDIDFRRPLEYIPTLSEHLQSLQSHLSSVDLPHSFCESVSYLKPHATLSELMDKVLSSDFVSGMSSDIRGGEDMLEKAAVEVARAIRRSLNGSRLIHYVDLPEQWRNNRFVARGYRYVVRRSFRLRQ